MPKNKPLTKMIRGGGLAVGLALLAGMPVTPALAPVASAQWEPRYNDELIFEDLTRRSENFIQSMIRNDAIAMRAEMSEATRATLTTAVINRMYSNLLRGGGRVREVGTPVIQNADQLMGYDYDEDTPVVVDVPIHLSSNSVTARITFERKTPLARITGFTIMPYDGEIAPDGRGYTRAEQFSRPPLYADRNLFRETETFVRSGDLALPARITMPAIASATAKVPAVVLIAGAEPADMDLARDSTAPFRDIAQGLATRGIAVMRYTNRSQIELVEANDWLPTANNVLIRDAVAAIEAMRSLPQVDPNRITVVGYRVGGTLAPFVAQEAGVERVVMLNAPSPPIDRHLRAWILAQQDSWGRLNHSDWEVVDGMLDGQEDLTAAQLLAAKPLIRQAPVFWQDVRRLPLAETLRDSSFPVVLFFSQGEEFAMEADKEEWQRMTQARRNPNTLLRVMENVDGRFIPLDADQGRRNVAVSLVDHLEMAVLRGRLASN